MVCLPPVHSASLYHAYAHKNNAFFISSSFPFLSSFHSSQDHMPSSLPTAPKVSFLTGYHIVSRIQTRSRYQFLVRTNRLEASQGALLLCSAVNSESCGTLFQEEATTLPSIPTLSHDDAESQYLRHERSSPVDLVLKGRQGSQPSPLSVRAGPGCLSNTPRGKIFGGYEAHWHATRRHLFFRPHLV